MAIQTLTRSSIDQFLSAIYGQIFLLKQEQTSGQRTESMAIFVHGHTKMYMDRKHREEERVFVLGNLDTTSEIQCSHLGSCSDLLVSFFLYCASHTNAPSTIRPIDEMCSSLFGLCFCLLCLHFFFVKDWKNKPMLMDNEEMEENEDKEEQGKKMLILISLMSC